MKFCGAFVMHRRLSECERTLQDLRPCVAGLAIKSATSVALAPRDAMPSDADSSPSDAASNGGCGWAARSGCDVCPTLPQCRPTQRAASSRTPPDAPYPCAGQERAPLARQGPGRHPGRILRSGRLKHALASRRRRRRRRGASLLVAKGRRRPRGAARCCCRRVWRTRRRRPRTPRAGTPSRSPASHTTPGRAGRAGRAGPPRRCSLSPGWGRTKLSLR
jgi:hypothetical protein